MIYSRLSQFRLPLIIARRSKGHSEILSDVSVSSHSLLHTEDLLKYLFSLSKQSCTKEGLMQVALGIVEGLNLSDLDFCICFDLPIERLSPGEYSDTYYVLSCKYRLNYLKCSPGNVFQFDMSISCNVKVVDGVVLPGKLSVGVYEPKDHLYFEHLLDIVQRYGKVVIYPIATYADKLLLQADQFSRVSAEDYIVLLKEALIKKDLGEGGFVSISYNDVYNMYNNLTEDRWSKDTRFYPLGSFQL